MQLSVKVTFRHHETPSKPFQDESGTKSGPGEPKVDQSGTKSGPGEPQWEPKGGPEGIQGDKTGRALMVINATIGQEGPRDAKKNH